MFDRCDQTGEAATMPPHVDLTPLDNLHTHPSTNVTISHQPVNLPTTPSNIPVHPLVRVRLATTTVEEGKGEKVEHGEGEYCFC